MVGVGGVEDDTCRRARLRHPHLPRAPHHPAPMEEASALAPDQGNDLTFKNNMF